MTDYYEARNAPDLGVPYYDLQPKLANGNFEGASFTFKHFDFEKMLELFRARYGEPTHRETQRLQTVGGAQLRGQQVTWRGKNVTVVLHEYGSRVDEGLVTVFTAMYVESLDKKDKENAARGKGNL